MIAQAQGAGLPWILQALDFRVEPSRSETARRRTGPAGPRYLAGRLAGSCIPMHKAAGSRRGSRQDFEIRPLLRPCVLLTVHAVTRPDTQVVIAGRDLAWQSQRSKD